MKLTKSEEKKIIAGKVRITREERPDFEPGKRHVVQWSERRWAGAEETGERWEVPPQPLLVAIERTSVRQLHHWEIAFDIEDYRDQRDLYLARRGAPYTTATGKEHTVDEASVLEPHARKKLEMDRRLEAALDMDREGKVSELATRNQERAAREEMRGALRGLDPPAQQALIAAVLREIRAAKNQRRAKAA